jgi:hypothetical protein
MGKEIYKAIEGGMRDKKKFETFDGNSFKEYCLKLLVTYCKHEGVWEAEVSAWETYSDEPFMVRDIEIREDQPFTDHQGRLYTRLRFFCNFEIEVGVLGKKRFNWKVHFIYIESIGTWFLQKSSVVSLEYL